MTIRDIRVARKFGVNEGGEPTEYGYEIQVQYVHKPSGEVYDFAREDVPWEPLAETVLHTGELVPTNATMIVTADPKEGE